MDIAIESERFVEAAPEQVGMSSSRLRNVSRLVQEYIDAEKFAGAISLVARHGKVVHFETYGNMDDARSKPMRAHAIFRFYSMTKPIASVGLMMLYEEGRFQLDDPASKFIPEFADLRVLGDNGSLRSPAPAMTVRDLLMHTSGLVGRETVSPAAAAYRKAGFKCAC